MLIHNAQPRGRRPNVIAAVSCDDGERLLTTAWQRARALEADLTICTAIAQPSAAAAREIDAIADRILATAPHDAMIRFDVRPGQITEQILACARELDAAQIIVGKSLRPAAARLAHTGVCTALLHDAAIPLLVAGPRRGTRRILVATDLADPGAPVLRAAAAEAGRDGSAVTALHCLTMRTSRDPHGASLGIALDELTSIAHARLARRLEEIRLAAARKVEIAPVARAILESAVALDVDLIVMGTRAHGAAGRVPVTRHTRPDLDRLLRGGVAERVAREAPCSVLLVPVDDLTLA